jgi:hypothetical protein
MQQKAIQYEFFSSIKIPLLLSFVGNKMKVNVGQTSINTFDMGAVAEQGQRIFAFFLMIGSS